ncbi:MAG: adenylate/guanylate cyclase domain-containing protein [Spirochaetales bacterium]|nr:adenylate/guanylate cyclase domain-containing protein [Spirochaetales bacterium]
MTSKIIRQNNATVFYYFDITFFSQKEIRSILRVSDKKKYFVGIIDHKQAISDPALLFSSGLHDYLGPQLCRQPMELKRFNEILCRQNVDFSDQEAGNSKNQLITSLVKKASDWKNVQTGTEYLFTMMYIELDGSRNFGNRVRESTIDRLLHNFQRTVESYVSQQNGRLWIWNDFGGIVLFPYNENPTEVIVTCMRLMLSRRIISVDNSEQKLLLSYRIVLYPGSTVYRERGKTGRIISDAVNSLAHIGQKYAHPGNMYVSKNMYTHCRQSIQECFTESGNFEGTELYSMRLPESY